MSWRFPPWGWWRRWQAQRLERRMAEEFAFHRAQERQRLETEGMPSRQTWRAADERFGDPTRIAALCRKAALGEAALDGLNGIHGIMAGGGTSMTFGHDLRHALRSLGRRPGFLAVVVLTAAVGIGATTSVFSVVSSVVLSPLPYPEPERLVRLYSAEIDEPDQRNFLPGPDFVDYRERSGAFAAAGAFYDYSDTGLDLTGLGTPRRVRALGVSAGYFDTLGVTPLYGRLILQEEEVGGEDDLYGTRVTVLSHHLWQELTGSDPGIVGETLELDGEAYTVAGVLRPGFLDVLHGEIDLWVPLNLDPGGRWNDRRNWYLSAVAQLTPGVSVAQAQARLDAVLEELRQEFPEDRAEQLVQVLPLFDDVVGSTPSTLYVLLGASVLVLLIAAVNVANLLVTRGLTRQRELAVRSALGSGRLRLVRELLLESGIAATLGGLLGVGLAYGGVRALLAVSPESLARAEEVSFDLRLLTFAVAVTFLTTLLFGLAPAVYAARIQPGDALRVGARGGDVTPTGRRIRLGLVAGQVALAAVLLIGAGVLIRSFTALQQVPLRFDPEGVLTFEVHLPDSRYGESRKRITFHRQLHERLRAIPGVTEAGATSKLPALGPYNIWGVAWLDETGEEQWSPAQARVVEGGYFEALGIPLLRGRFLDERDRADAAPVVVVNQALVDEVWPEAAEEVLGREIRAGSEERRIVGIVADVPYDHLGSVGPKFYMSHAQHGDNRNWALTQVVETEGDPRRVVQAIRAELATLDAELVLHRPAPLADLLHRQRASQRFVVLLMGIFAAVALALAVVGIYGVLAFTVVQRTREIGIRVALGARLGQVLGAVVGQGALLAAVGLTVGLLAAWMSGHVLDSLLFQARARDPWVFLAVGLGLAAVTLLAGLPPARRAKRIDPMVALREE